MCFMFPEHLHSAYLCSPRVWSHHFNWRLYSHVRLCYTTSGSSSETQRIVVISQVSGVVSAQRLNKALKINHSSFLGANSHSELLQSGQSVLRLLRVVFDVTQNETETVRPLIQGNVPEGQQYTWWSWLDTWTTMWKSSRVKSGTWDNLRNVCQKCSCFKWQNAPWGVKCVKLFALSSKTQSKHFKARKVGINYFEPISQRWHFNLVMVLMVA